jgi:SAM-dependent methyltransferase
VQSPPDRAYTPHPEDPLLELAEARHYNEWIFDRARPYLGERVLDVGAGLGVFTELALEAGAEVVAAEPDPSLAEQLRERLGPRPGLVVREEPAEALDTAREFDSALCLNVLEHLPDDTTVVRRFARLLRPGGRLLLLVPAHRALYGAYDRAVGHHRRYERDELGRLLVEAGYEVEDLRHVNPVGAAGWVVRFRLWRTSHWPATSFRTFDRLVPVLRHLDRVPVPFGLSLWAVARTRG